MDKTAGAVNITVGYQGLEIALADFISGQIILRGSVFLSPTTKRWLPTAHGHVINAISDKGGRRRRSVEAGRKASPTIGDSCHLLLMS